VLKKPEQGLPGAAEFRHLVEDEDNSFLDTAIRILLKLVTDLYEADRGCDDEFTTPRLFMTGRQGTLAQKIKLLSIPAIAGEARDLPRRNRTDLAEADLGDHAVKSDARYTAGGRAAEVIIDRIDTRPAQCCQAIAHRIL
jgi:hypothetical protein